MASMAHNAVMSRVAGARPQAASFGNKMAPAKAQAVRANGRSALCVRASYSSRPSENAEQTDSRRAAESQRVDERTMNITTARELDAFLIDAGDKLVMLNMESDDECDIGDNPESWMVDGEGDGEGVEMAACVKLKSDLERVARDADDVVFLNMNVEEPGAKSLAKELGASTFPTQQYYKNGQLVWQHSGAGSETLTSIGEGVLYYGGQAGAGQRASAFIDEVKDQASYNDWMEMCAFPTDKADVACDKQLAVLDVSLLKDSPQCMHIFPAVLALAKNTAGFTRFARLMGDESSDAAAMMTKLGVTQVPTFIFYVDGKEVDRFTGNDRMAVVGKVLDVQMKSGIVVKQEKRSNRMTNEEARALAKSKREQEAKTKAKNLF